MLPLGHVQHRDGGCLLVSDRVHRNDGFNPLQETMQHVWSENNYEHLSNFGCNCSYQAVQQQNNEFHRFLQMMSKEITCISPSI